MLPQFTMRSSLEAGVHFGHQTHRWNPKMQDYLFGTRNKIHVIDLSKTVPLLHQAVVAASDVIAQGGRILFVGTKPQASDPVAVRQALRAIFRQPPLAGRHAHQLEDDHQFDQALALSGRAGFWQRRASPRKSCCISPASATLERALGGIRIWAAVPDLLFVIDTNKEAIAIAEALKLKIPIIAVIDSNSVPTALPIRFPAMTTRAGRSRFTRFDRAGCNRRHRARPRRCRHRYRRSGRGF